MKAKATYSVKKWDEKACELNPSVRKMSRTSVEYSFEGDLTGLATVEYVMLAIHEVPEDQHKSTTNYVGFIHFQGKLTGKEGTFCMEDQGLFKSGAARSSLKIVDNTGTGSLQGIRGTGTYCADQNGCVFELDYQL